MNSRLTSISVTIWTTLMMMAVMVEPLTPRKAIYPHTRASATAAAAWGM